jgi:CheY-like chemotaxis protein
MAERRPAGAPAPGRPGPLRILVVDDDPDVLQTVENILRLDGHRVVGASGGQRGIEAFQAAEAEGDRFGLVITDLGMPVVDGHGVAAAIKARSATTPVILMTGWGQGMIAAGEDVPHVDHVLAKPPELRLLRAAVARFAAPPP